VKLDLLTVNSLDKPDNYFEILNQETSMPSPILVKRSYKEIMKSYADKEGPDEIDLNTTMTEA